MKIEVTINYQAFFGSPVVSDTTIFENEKSEKTAYQRAYRHFNKLKRRKGVNVYRPMILDSIKTKEL